MKLPGTTGSYGVRTTLRRPADRARRIYLIRVLNIRASRGEPRRVPFSRKARSSGGSRAARTPSSSSSSTSRSTRSPATSGRSGSRRGSRPRASSWSRRATRSPRSTSAARRRRRGRGPEGAPRGRAGPREAARRGAEGGGGAPAGGSGGPPEDLEGGGPGGAGPRGGPRGGPRHRPRRVRRVRGEREEDWPAPRDPPGPRHEGVRGEGHDDRGETPGCAEAPRRGGGRRGASGGDREGSAGGGGEGGRVDEGAGGPGARPPGLRDDPEAPPGGGQGRGGDHGDHRDAGDGGEADRPRRADEPDPPVQLRDVRRRAVEPVRPRREPRGLEEPAQRVQPAPDHVRPRAREDPPAERDRQLHRGRGRVLLPRPVPERGGVHERDAGGPGLREDGGVPGEIPRPRRVPARRRPLPERAGGRAGGAVPHVQRAVQRGEADRPHERPAPEGDPGPRGPPRVAVRERIDRGHPGPRVRDPDRDPAQAREGRRGRGGRGGARDNRAARPEQHPGARRRAEPRPRVLLPDGGGRDPGDDAGGPPGPDGRGAPPRAGGGGGGGARPEAGRRVPREGGAAHGHAPR